MRSENRTTALSRVRSTAARQHEIVLTRQLVHAGLARGEMLRLCGEGWLTPVRRGAYLLGQSEVTPWHRVVAAALVAGPGTALSHSTAAQIHRFSWAGDVSGYSVEMTAGPDRRVFLTDVRLHRAATLDPADLTQYKGLTATTPARTLVDLASRLETEAVARLIDEGLVARMWDVVTLRAAAGRVGQRRGWRRLAALLDERDGEPGTDSPLEQRVVRALSGMGPFETQHQVVVEGRVFLLDIAWPPYKVAAECDGWHVRSRSRGKFDQDRRRNNLLEANGWRIAHLTSAMSDEEIRSATMRLLLQAASAIVPVPTATRLG